MLMYLWGVDSALLEGTAAWVMGAQVAVFTPVAEESAVYTGQTPAGQSEHLTTHRTLSLHNIGNTPCILSCTAFTQYVIC